MIQGTSSGAGKTTLVAALCRIFSDKGYSVAPFKSQNMSNFAYITPKFEISRAQAIQAIGSRCKITPDLNPILLKPTGNYNSIVYLNGKRYKKMHAKEYYEKFVNTEGIRIASKSLKILQKNFDLVILEGAGSPAEINLQKFDIANMKIAQKARASVLLVSDIDRGGSFASFVGTMALIEKKYQKLVKGFIFNKFRGDLDVLKPGFQKLKNMTKKPVLGTIPLMTLDLPEEDSLNAKTGFFVIFLSF
jgi:adenosylcobyric acid synthase